MRIRHTSNSALKAAESAASLSAAACTAPLLGVPAAGLPGLATGGPALAGAYFRWPEDMALEEEEEEGNGSRHNLFKTKKRSFRRFTRHRVFALCPKRKFALCPYSLLCRI